MSLNILIIDDKASFRQNLKNELLNKGITNVHVANNVNIGYDIIKTRDVDIALVDSKLIETIDEFTFNETFTKRNVKVLLLVLKEDYGKDYIFRLLKIGAVDLIEVSDAKKINNKIIDDILVQAENATSANLNAHYDRFNLPSFKIQVKRKSTNQAIVIASSTGGPKTLEQVIPLFPKELPLPVFVVQHMPPLFTKSLADRLNSISDMTVKEAEDGEVVKKGFCYMAPGNYHMRVIEVNGEKLIKLSQEDKQLGVRPNANILMKSVADIYQGNTLAIVLTGMGTDGTDGAIAVKKYQGTVLVEAEEDCVIYGMPKSVVNSGNYDIVVRLDKIAVQAIHWLDI